MHIDGVDLSEEAFGILQKNASVVNEGANVRSTPHSLNDALCSCKAGFEPICSYLSQFPRAQHKPALVLITAIELHQKYGLALFSLSHEEMHEVTARDSQNLVQSLRSKFPADAAFPQIPQVAKTITLSVDVGEMVKHFLVTLPAEQGVSPSAMVEIAKVTGISKNRLGKHSTINRDFDPVTHFGREPGMVGPFPDHVAEIDGIIYLRNKHALHIALRYTPTDTVFMARQLFEAILYAYSKSAGLACHVIDFAGDPI